MFLLRTEGKLRIEGRKGRKSRKSRKGRKGKKGKPLDSSKKVHRTRRVQSTWNAKKQLFARGILCQRQNDALPIFGGNAIGPQIAVKSA